MKKCEKVKEDELRPEYQREDFGTMVRGKHAALRKEASNVVVIDPEADFVSHSLNNRRLC
jgi:hypothetical protein